MENVEKPIVYGADATWGNHGKDIVVSRFWEVYFNDMMKGPDEVIVNISTAEVGEVEDGLVGITITPNENLVKEYPGALAVIDGKWYDLNIFNNPISLNAAAGHRISIVWAPQNLVETFIVSKKVA